MATYYYTDDTAFFDDDGRVMLGSARLATVGVVIKLNLCISFELLPCGGWGECVCYAGFCVMCTHP